MNAISDRTKTLNSFRNDLLSKVSQRDQKILNKDNTSNIDEIINRKIQNFTIEVDLFYHQIQAANLTVNERESAEKALQCFENDISLFQDKLRNKIKPIEDAPNEDNLLDLTVGLKSAAIQMNEELKYQNSTLEKIDSKVEQKTEHIRKTNKKLDKLLESASDACLISTILIEVLILILIVILL